MLYATHHGAVLAYAARRLRVREDAEDVAAETFQIAWRRLDEIPARERAWLLSVAHHRLVDRSRRRERGNAVMAHVARREELPTGADPYSDPRHDALDVLAALASLDEPDREAIMLVAWDDLSYREAAQVLGLGLTAFSMRLLRARRRLARALENAAAEAGVDAGEADLPSVKEKT